MTFTIKEFNKWYDEGIYLSLEEICVRNNLSTTNKEILITYCKKLPELEKIISYNYPKKGSLTNNKSFAKDLSNKLITYDSISLEEDKKIRYLKNIFQLNKLFSTIEAETVHVMHHENHLWSRVSKFKPQFQDLMYEFELICRFKEHGWEIIDLEPFTTDLKTKKSEFRAKKNGQTVHVEVKKIDGKKIWKKMTGESKFTMQKNFEDNIADYKKWETDMIDTDKPFEIVNLTGIIRQIVSQIEAATIKFGSTSDQYLIYVKGDYLLSRKEILEKINEYLLANDGGTQSFFDKNNKCTAVVFEDPIGGNQGIALNPSSILTRDKIPMGGI